MKLTREIYRSVPEEWSESIAGKYPELLTMDIFDAFDVTLKVMQDVKTAARITMKLTGREFSVERLDIKPVDGLVRVVRIK
jgi:hypothetical protein